MPDSSPAVPCPLCGFPSSVHLRARQRVYRHCAKCGLIHVPAVFHLSPEEERAIYELHTNHPAEQGYRDFLDRALRPTLAGLPPGAQGLDFGSGPGPTLSLMATERGYPCVDYDPYFAPHSERLSATYDFITVTEAIEHFASPLTELTTLFGCLRPGGRLCIMTKRIPDTPFADWHYPRDPTHIAFFAERTFAWIGKRFGAGVEFVGRDVVLLTV